MKPSTILSGAATLLDRLSGLKGPWGIAAGFGSALLGVGSTLLDAPDETPHVQRINDSAPIVAAALARAEVLKAKLVADSTSTTPRS